MPEEKEKSGGWFSRFSSNGRDEADERRRLVEEAEAAAEALRVLRSIHDQTENDNQQLRAEVTLLESSTECVQEELTEAQRKLAEAEKTCEQRDAELKTLEEASEALKTQVAELEKTAKTAREQEREATQQLAEERRKATVGAQRQRTAQKEVERQYERRDKELTKLTEELQSLREQLAERDARDAKRDEQEAKRDVQKAEHEAREAELRQAQEKLAAAEAQLAELPALQEALKQAETRAEQLDAERGELATAMHEIESTRDSHAALLRDSEQKHAQEHSQWAEELQAAEADRDRLRAALDDQSDEDRKVQERWLSMIGGLWTALEHVLGPKAGLALPAQLRLSPAAAREVHSSDMAQLSKELDEALEILSVPAKVTLVLQGPSLELTLSQTQSTGGALPPWAAALAMHQVGPRMGRPLRAMAPRDEGSSLVMRAQVHDA